MLDLVAKRVQMVLIRYNLQVTVRPQPDWKVREREITGDEEEQAVDEQREHLIARRRERVREV